MGEAGDDFIRAMSRGNYKGDPGFYRNAAAGADASVSDLVARRKASIEEGVLKEKQEASDPQSVKNRRFRAYWEGIAPEYVKAIGPEWENVTAQDAHLLMEPVKLIEEGKRRKATAEATAAKERDRLAREDAEKKAKEARQEFEDKRTERHRGENFANAREVARIGREAKAGDEKKKAEDKKKEQLIEVDQRANLVESNIGKLEEMIRKHGTAYWTGPEGAIVQGIISDIAIDMAKLKDPESVARESETATEQKHLFKPGFFQSDDSALAQLSAYRNRVRERRGEAYKARGITPGAPGAPAGTTSIRMRFPDGSVHDVAANEIDMAKARGGVEVP
jgi:hypothetical protein